MTSDNDDASPFPKKQKQVRKTENERNGTEHPLCRIAIPTPVHLDVREYVILESGSSIPNAQPRISLLIPPHGNKKGWGVGRWEVGKGKKSYRDHSIGNEKPASSATEPRVFFFVAKSGARFLCMQDDPMWLCASARPAVKWYVVYAVS